MTWGLRKVLSATMCLLATSSIARGDEVADFFKDKTLSITSAGSAGGGYGLYAILLSEHMSRHVPGQPAVVVKYMQGAGGTLAANHHFNVAPKDGTAILAPLQSMTTLQMLGKAGVRYDASKFQWIGRSVEVTSMFATKPSAATSIADLRKPERSIVVGIAAVGAPNHIMAALLAYGAGANLKMVAGYEGSNGMALAYGRNEIEALALPLESLRLAYPNILKDTMIAQSGLERHKAFPNVPLVMELTDDPEKKKVIEFFQVQETIGRAYVLPPGTPVQRVAALRKALIDTMQDAAFVASAAKRKTEVNAMAGEALQKLVEAHIATSPDIIERAKDAVGIK